MRVLKKGSAGHDVKMLKHYLNVLLSLTPPLDEANSKFDDATVAAVNSFKQGASLTPLDGKVTADVWGAIGAQYGGRFDRIQPEKVVGRICTINDDPATIPQWMANLTYVAVDGPLDIDHKLFFQAFSSQFGIKDEPTMAGLYQLLKFMDLDPEVMSVRDAAYMLATAYWETARTFLPIEEYGKGAGKAYGKEVSVKAPDGKTYKNKYFGRGYVQLTWDYNYKKLGKALGIGDDLYYHPEKALEPETAYKVFTKWMNGGESANRKKTAEYTKGAKPNYKGARAMVNGTDHNEDIAALAVSFEAMLTASLRRRN
jgi:hypothetical protein